ncbi:MAG: DNA-processing protein DprA, partial [Nitrospiria bacterium]
KQIPGIGNILYRRLLQTFKTPEAAFNATEAALISVEGISTGLAKKIHSFSDFDTVDRDLEKADKSDTSILTFNDSDYPSLLATIDDPPPFLYVKGSWNGDLHYPIAVVGSRKTTTYGRSVTERLCRSLSENGMIIISGFARGIDSHAHRAALTAGGRTIAVLGCGIDVCYPVENKKLFHEILEQGAIISEFPMDALPEPHHFPQRNRIISGLSLGCVVIESGLRSGSLITARLALEQGREVFAVPGSIFSDHSAGPHHLIASGAKLVRGVEDILEEILPQVRQWTLFSESKKPDLEEDEEKIFSLLSFDPKHVDLVISESTMPTSVVSNLLLMLELKGFIRQQAGQYYVRT